MNCEIRSTQNWKAPGRFLALFRKVSKHRKVQNPARSSWGLALFKRKQSSPAEISGRLSLSPATGHRDVQLQGSEVARGLRQHTRSPEGGYWMSLSRSWQQGWPLWGEARAAGWTSASQPRSTHHTWSESSGSSSERDRPLLPQPGPPGPQDS